MNKSEVSHTMWLYGQEDLYELRYLSQLEAHFRRLSILKENLRVEIDKKIWDAHRCKEIMEAIEWWRDRFKEIWGTK